MCKALGVNDDDASAMLQIESRCCGRSTSFRVGGGRSPGRSRCGACRHSQSAGWRKRRSGSQGELCRRCDRITRLVDAIYRNDPDCR
jgi:hypothetical protein